MCSHTARRRGRGVGRQVERVECEKREGERGGERERGREREREEEKEQSE